MRIAWNSWLSQLTFELGKSGPDSISVTVIKRTEEIEKLSRKIKAEAQQQ